MGDGKQFGRLTRREAMALADHVVVMNHGRIEDQGTPERVYGQPATRFSATFMGESTILPAQATADGCIRTVLGSFAARTSVGAGEFHVAIRPEHVQLGPGIEVLVSDVVYQGSFKRVTAVPTADPSLRLLARLPADAAVTEGDAISLRIDPERLIVLKD